MADYQTNSESGYPSGFDYYSYGSEETAKAHITTPPGLTTVAQSARVNPHHDENHTRPVGMPGSTYTPSREDKIILSEGGHAIVMGDAAGSETMRVQSKHGAIMEMSSDGRMLLSSPTGYHVAIGGDGHLVFSGELHIVSSGDIRFKGSNMHFDCQDFQIHASGDMIANVHGSKNESIVGDSHSTVQGDASTAVGGTTSHTTAGDMKIQTAGDMSVAAKGTASYSSVGDASLSTKGKLTTTSKGDTTVNSKGKTGINSTGDLTVVGAAKVSVASGSDTTVGAKGTMKIVGDGGTNITTNGAMKLGAGTIDAQSGANKATPDWVGGGSAPKESAPDAKVEIKDPEVVVPDEKQILDNVGDYVGTDGKIDKIYSASQLDHFYNTEEGGKIPDKVMARAKQIGAIDDSYSPPKGESNSEGTSGYALHTYSSGLGFNPDV